MNYIFYNRNFVFKKFLYLYSYKLFLYISNKNIYFYLFSFFKFNIIFNISTNSIFLRNYFVLNFGKNINFNVFGFLGKIVSDVIIFMNIFNLRFVNSYNYSYNLKNFFFFFKKNIF